MYHLCSRWDLLSFWSTVWILQEVPPCLIKFIIIFTETQYGTYYKLDRLGDFGSTNGNGEWDEEILFQFTNKTIDQVFRHRNVTILVVNLRAIYMKRNQIILFPNKTFHHELGTEFKKQFIKAISYSWNSNRNLEFSSYSSHGPSIAKLGSYSFKDCQKFRIYTSWKCIQIAITKK